MRVVNTLGKVTKRFQDAMRMVRAADPQRKEDGFQLLHEHVTEHTDELIAEFEQEYDHGLRCWQHNCTAPTKHSAAGGHRPGEPRHQIGTPSPLVGIA